MGGFGITSIGAIVSAMKQLSTIETATNMAN